MTETTTAPEPVIEGRPLARFGFDSVIDDNPGWRYLWGRDGWNDSPPLPEPPVITAALPGAVATQPEPAAEPAEPEPQPEPATAAPASIADVAADTHGVGDLTRDQREALARFDSAHDAEDKRTATVQIPVVEAVTEITPAVTEGEAK